jgi:hypothetical protein
VNNVHNPHYSDEEKSIQEKTFPTVISFYTTETLYQLEVQNLIASCQAFDLETSIEGMPSFGSWELNCAYKPFFIFQKLKSLQRPLLWVDADGVFVQKPSWLSCFSCDLATRIEAELPSDHASKVISSTIYVNYTDKSAHLLRLWADECQRQLLNSGRTEEFWDQVALRNVLLANESKAKIASLPLTYVKIFDHPHDQHQAPEPVIMHYQASRRLKKTIH